MVHFGAKWCTFENIPAAVALHSIGATPPIIRKCDASARHPQITASFGRHLAQARVNRRDPPRVVLRFGTRCPFFALSHLAGSISNSARARVASLPGIERGDAARNCKLPNS